MFCFTCEGHVQVDGSTGQCPGHPHEACSMLHLMPVKFFLIVVVFRDRLSLCNSPNCPGTNSVDQADLKRLKLTEIHLPLPPEY